MRASLFSNKKSYLKPLWPHANFSFIEKIHPSKSKPQDGTKPAVLRNVLK